jgi:enoyl-CoA hydratase/carnithine racemase
MAASKLQMYLDLHRDAATAVHDSARRLELMMEEADFAEGVAAMSERRRPRFADPSPPRPADPSPPGT